jgi:hypothetical protein
MWKNYQNTFMITATFASNGIRWTVSEDGGVLLNLKTGKLFKIDPVGALVWGAMTQSTSEIDLDRLIDRLHQTFTNVPRERLDSDIRLFLNQLAKAGLVSSTIDASFSNGEPLNDIALRTIPAIERYLEFCTVPDMSPVASSSLKPSLILTILAILALVGCDLAVTIGGFRFVHFMLIRFPRWRAARVKAWTVDRVCVSIDLACSLYLKRTLCLQRSFVGTLLLRLCGFPATMVIGARIIPFQSHAWIELDGRVVCDNQTVKAIYPVLERC